MIKKATYGGVDCTDKVKSFTKKGRLNLWVNNDIIGDTQPGKVKYLELEVTHITPLTSTITGGTKSLWFKEGTMAIYPQSTATRLGIFYSNNNNSKITPAITESIKSIELTKLSHIGRIGIADADIITCVWEKLPYNPFIELISNYKVSSHLNQVMQILQCLYFARETKAPYEYVSFLEHDVLYPAGYFSFPDFEEGTILTNMNYGGLSALGWQEKNQMDEPPMHQMTMRFNDAIKHFESILPNAMLTNSGMVEPQKMKREQWQSKHQAIHINHGYHFTSHNSIYRKEYTENHPYWGKSSFYQHLFK
jgi:hypothetical protein